jgi:uncharacterized protein (TIGR03435 family)
VTTNILAEIALAVGRSFELSIIVKATVLVAVALGATRLARRARASVRHVLLASTFGALLMLPIAAAFAPLVAVEIPISQGPEGIPPPSIRQDDGAQHSSGMSTALPQPGQRRISASTVIRAGWATGAMLFLVPLVASLWRLQRVRLCGLPWPKAEPLVRTLAIEAGIHRSVDIFLHDDIVAPMTFGLVRPAIALPSNAQEWPDADVQRAVVHELEHVHCADWPVRLVARVVCALYWFHPLIWTAWRRLRLESERACDDAVLRGADRTAYAEQLVMLARRLSTRAARPVLSMANRSDLAARVSAVLDSNQPRGRAGTVHSAAIVSAVVLLLLAISPLGAVGHTPRDNVLIASKQPAPLADANLSVPQPRAQSLAPRLSMVKDASMKPKPELNATRPPAQSQAAEASNASFVITSVKANRSGNARVYPFTLGPDGRFAVTNMTLRNLLGAAYQGSRIEDKTSWLDSERFDIEGKAEGNPSREQMWSMVRKLLADRFYLIAHTEVRVVPGYALILARTDGSFGPRLRSSACVGKDTAPFQPYDPKQPPPLPCGSARGRPTGNMEARWQTMEELAFGLFTPMFGRKVVDQTGLTEKFDLEVEWTPAPGPPGPAALGVGPATFAAMEEQLGLRLDPQPGPVDFLVIDRVERPTEDQ